MRALGGGGCAPRLCPKEVPGATGATDPNTKPYIKLQYPPNATGRGSSPRARRSSACAGSGLTDVLRLQTLGTLRHIEFHAVALGQAAEALGLDRREVDEHVWTRLLRDKAKALRVVEPLHLTLCHTVQNSALW